MDKIKTLLLSAPPTKLESVAQGWGKGEVGSAGVVGLDVAHLRQHVELPQKLLVHWPGRNEHIIWNSGLDALEKSKLMLKNTNAHRRQTFWMWHIDHDIEGRLIDCLQNLSSLSSSLTSRTDKKFIILYASQEYAGKPCFNKKAFFMREKKYFKLLPYPLFFTHFLVELKPTFHCWCHWVVRRRAGRRLGLAPLRLRPAAKLS